MLRSMVVILIPKSVSTRRIFNAQTTRVLGTRVFSAVDADCCVYIIQYPSNQSASRNESGSSLLNGDSNESVTNDSDIISDMYDDIE
uniref:Uncharacterized protein n=1 Tax=Pararge aegeria TaxID=116150 RepID=S4NQ39_9NEOP